MKISAKHFGLAFGP